VKGKYLCGPHASVHDNLMHNLVRILNDARYPNTLEGNFALFESSLCGLRDNMGLFDEKAADCAYRMLASYVHEAHGGDKGTGHCTCTFCQVHRADYLRMQIEGHI